MEEYLHKEVDFNQFQNPVVLAERNMNDLSWVTGTTSRKRIMDINVVAECVNHNISKTDCDNDTFL